MRSNVLRHFPKHWSRRCSFMSNPTFIPPPQDLSIPSGPHRPLSRHSFPRGSPRRPGTGPGAYRPPCRFRAEDLAVCEQDRCRAVPRFHHCCVIAVEILYLLPHIAVMFPRRRDRDHDSQRKIHAAHGKEFQRVGDILPYFQFCANITSLQNCQII